MLYVRMDTVDALRSSLRESNLCVVSHRYVSFFYCVCVKIYLPDENGCLLSPGLEILFV